MTTTAEYQARIRHLRAKRAELEARTCPASASGAHCASCRRGGYCCYCADWDPDDPGAVAA